MSRGVIYTATYKDFLNGVLTVELPVGYNRIQFNQFTAGGTTYVYMEELSKNQLHGWIPLAPEGVDVNYGLGDPFVITQTAPLGKTYSKTPNSSIILKVYCEGIDAQSPIVAAARVGDTVYLGMNGNPYKVTNKTLRIYIVNELDMLVNNLGIILQFTFL